MGNTSSDNSSEGRSGHSDHSSRGCHTDSHVRMPDDTVLVVRKFPGMSRAGVLIIPNHDCTILRYERLAESLQKCGMNVFLLELRGHGLSEGTWEPRKHDQDIAQLIEALRYHQYHGALYLVAEGVSAMLLLQDQPAVTGMVLLDPVLRWHDMALAPVHLRLPTKIVMRGGAPELLKRVFGPVSVVTYDGTHGNIQWLHVVQESLLAFQNNVTMASPIRHPALKKGIAG